MQSWICQSALGCMLFTVINSRRSAFMVWNNGSFEQDISGGKTLCAIARHWRTWLDKSQDVIMIMITRSIFVCTFLVITFVTVVTDFPRTFLACLSVGAAMVSLLPDPLDRAPDYVHQPSICAHPSGWPQTSNKPDHHWRGPTYTQLIAPANTT